jgi:hypothetical protein
VFSGQVECRKLMLDISDYFACLSACVSTITNVGKKHMLSGHGLHATLRAKCLVNSKDGNKSTEFLSSLLKWM